MYLSYFIVFYVGYLNYVEDFKVILEKKEIWKNI